MVLNFTTSSFDLTCHVPQINLLVRHEFSSTSDWCPASNLNDLAKMTL
jgi:hypothetical protein